MFRFLILSLILTSCSQIFLDVKYLKREPVKVQHVVTKTKGQDPDHVNVHRWAALIFISNSYDNFNILQVPTQLCEGSDSISNLTLDYSFWFIPLVWHNMNFDYQGVCHE